jgi:transposase
VIRNPAAALGASFPNHEWTPIRIRCRGGRFAVEELPANAPELNPVKYLWGWWKPRTVANGCARTEAALHWLARRGLRQAQRRKATLVSAFWKQVDLRA